MVKSKNIDFEEIFIQSLLFKDNPELINLIKKINYDKLVKLASKHLIIPTIYIRLKKQKLLKYFDNELKEYFEFIYNQNFERNKTLVNELREISNLFISNEINHVFLKGSSNITNDIYDNLGERMIGDIDILVEDGQEFIANNLLEKKGYQKLSKFSFTRHLPRMVNKSKLFAIEIHTKFIDQNNFYIDKKIALKTKILANNIYCLNKENQYLLNIYNQMINDKSYYYFSHSYRNYYDECLIKKKHKIKLEELRLDDFLRTFFMIKSKVFATNQFNEKEIFSTYFKVRYFLRNSLKIYFHLDNLFTKAYLSIKIKPSQILRLLKNGEYRQYLKEKILF